VPVRLFTDAERERLSRFPQGADHQPRDHADRDADQQRQQQRTEHVRGLRPFIVPLRHGLCWRPSMNDADMQAERELLDDLLRTANNVLDDLRTGESASVWHQRREEIAALRQRVHAMTDTHLGI
jgi:hypothetical protein